MSEYGTYLLVAHAVSLHSTQQSIQKAVGFALKYFANCAEDLWGCIVEECQKVPYLALSSLPATTLNAFARARLITGSTSFTSWIPCARHLC